MLIRKVQILLLVVVIPLTVVFSLLGFFRTAKPVEASGEARVAAKAEDLWPSAKPEPEYIYTIPLTDPDYFWGEILDLSGNILGEGLHFGRVKCTGDNCSQKTTIVLDGVEYTYKFSSRQAHDPDARRLVVEGIGTLTNERQKERFSFTATFEDNRDGTVKTAYVASRPDASFVVPDTSGRFEIRSK